MRIEDFKRLAVVSIDSGAKLGYVEDLLFDARSLGVGAFVVKAEGQQSVLPRSEVRSIGSDAITVANDAALRAMSAASGLASMPDMERMTRLKVVDEAGNYLGKVKDLDIDAQDGKIDQVEVHEGGVLGFGGNTSIIVAEDIRSIGDEIMVVAVPSLTRTVPEKQAE